LLKWDYHDGAASLWDPLGNIAESEMALSIKHPEADILARELASLTHVSITDAVVPRIKEELRSISDCCAGLPDIDTRSAEDIIGFDEHGIPV